MSEIDKLIALREQLLGVREELDKIGKKSLFIIKGCELIRGSSDASPSLLSIRDKAIKINYLAQNIDKKMRGIVSESRRAD